ncbi:18018_t:CDS:1, partial [Cetraspora pellucida]
MEFIPDPKISSSYNIISISEHYIKIKNRKTELIEDKKTFDSLMKIIADNIENDKLYEVYTTLKKPLIAETIACNK